MKNKVFILSFVLCVLCYALVYATPSTLIWTPSTDVKAFKVFHLDADNYTPVRSRDHLGNKTYVLQDYGLLAGLLPDKPENNILGKLWSPLGKIMAEAGFDYKKGLGSYFDTYPWYFHAKVGLPEDAYFKNMPALAIGIYDAGVKAHKTNNNVGYVRLAKTVDIGKFNLGRFSFGYFNGSGRLLRDKNGLRDNNGPMFAWERTMSEITDKLWVCVDYQGTQSAYGAFNVGFSYKFTNNISAIIGYDIYNNPNLKNTATFQLDVDF